MAISNINYNEKMNSSEEEAIKFVGAVFFVEIKTWSFVYYMVVTTITILANGFLIFAMLKDPLKCFLNATSYFIFHLAFSDLLNSLMFMEESLLWLTKFGGINGLPRAFRILNFVVFQVVFFANLPSIFSLALERCLSIVFPLWHKVNVTTGVCRIWLAMIWVLGGFSVGIRYGLLIYFEQERAYKVTATLGSGIFVVATLVCYSTGAFTVRKRRLALKQDTTISKATQKSAEVRLRNENRFLRTMFIIFLGFLLGVIPSMVCLWVLDVVSTESRNHVIKYTFNVSDMMLLLNYAVNTFIYLWRLPKYRKTFQVLYCRKNTVQRVA